MINLLNRQISYKNPQVEKLSSQPGSTKLIAKLTGKVRLDQELYERKAIDVYSDVTIGQKRRLPGLSTDALLHVGISGGQVEMGLSGGLTSGFTTLSLSLIHI